MTAVRAMAEELEAPEEDPRGETSDEDQLQLLNRQFFVIEEGGKHFVACEWMDPVRQRLALKRYTFEEFKKRLMGRTVTIGDGSHRRSCPLARAWLEWEGRRQYLGGVVFDPTGQSLEDTFNLWRGWPISPRPGDWSMLREHIREVICGGSEELDAYFLGWLRRLVQHPERPGEVVPVLRGKPGAGKTVVGDAVRRIFGQHAMAVSSPRAVTGQFNAHLRDLVFLLANEAFFAGDRGSVSTLKSLITDDTLFLEQKGLDAVEVPNFLHVLMTTNADWAVPVSLDDRRFVVFDVAESHVGRRDYFDRLQAAVRNPVVLGAMLHDLLDPAALDGFQVRDIPDTGARAEQMVHSLEGPAAWLFHVLALGSLGNGSEEWPEWASNHSLQVSIDDWAKAGKFRQTTDPSSLGRYLAQIFRAGRPRRPRPDGKRPTGYYLFTLEAARARFCEVTRLPRSVFPAAEPEDGGGQGSGQGWEGD